DVAAIADRDEMIAGLGERKQQAVLRERRDLRGPRLEIGRIRRRRCCVGRRRLVLRERREGRNGEEELDSGPPPDARGGRLRGNDGIFLFHAAAPAASAVFFFGLIRNAAKAGSRMTAAPALARNMIVSSTPMSTWNCRPDSSHVHTLEASASAVTI